MKAHRWFILFSSLVALSLIVTLSPRATPPPRAASPAPAADPTDLFISEYLEGSSNNKALEIFNGTGAAVNLAAGGYDIQVFFNGSPSAGLTIPMTGSVANGDVYVLAHASADPAVLAQADQTNGANWFNGNDAVALRKNGAIVDVIGQAGFDPVSEWGAGFTSTQDNTLRRLDNICQGDPNGADAFDPAVEWEGFAADTFAGLGVHTVTCLTTPFFLINEVDAAQAGPDTAEFIEIYDGVGGFTSLNGLVVVLYSGVDDASYRAFDLENNRATNGYFVICGNASVITGCAMQVGADFLQDGPAAVALYSGEAADFPNGTSVTAANLLDAIVYDTGDPDDPGLLALLNPGQPQVNENETGSVDTVSNQRCPHLAGGARNTNTYKQFLPTNERTNTCQLEIGACGGPATPIHKIQGNGTASPLAGTQRIVEGVVVGDFQSIASGLGGFFVQEETGQFDADDQTSEGIFVYDHGFGVDVGWARLVRVMGEVTEYGGLTEIKNVSHVLVCSQTELPVHTTALTLPVTALGDWERWEGMLVNLPQTLFATDTFNLGRYGEVELSAFGRLYNPTQLVSPGPAALELQGQNDRSRIQLDDGNFTNPHPLSPYLGADNTLRLGDTVARLTGVLSYSNGGYEIHPTLPVAFTRANPRAPQWVMPEGSLRIVSTNLLNFFTTLDTGAKICGPAANLECRGANTAAEFTRQRTKIINAFQSLDPDIAGVLEVENNASAALQNLVDGLNTAFGAGTYAFINTGTIGTDAIKVGLIYKPAKVSPVGAYKILDSAVDPNFLDAKNRPSLAQTFQTPAGSRFTLAVNHFKSKGSSCADVGDPDAGDGQGNCNLTRLKAAQALSAWLASDPTGSGDPDFLILGDLNAYAKEDPVTAIKNAGYTDLVAAFTVPTAYSYTFEGQSGTLDYALARPSLARQVGNAYDYHVNADEPSALDYNDYNQAGLYTPELYRYADHDPIVVFISPWQVTQVGNELRIFYSQANSIPQYAVLHLDDSYFRLNYGPASGWGASLMLMPAFWSGGVYYHAAPVTTEYQVVGDKLVLDVRGVIHGLQVYLTVSLFPPYHDSIRGEIEAKLVGSVPLDNRPGEAFKPLFLSSMHVSPTEWDSALAFAGCVWKRIPGQGWLIPPASKVEAATFGLVGGTSAWKTNSPTLKVELGSPMQIAGWVTPSGDPNDDNVGLWAASTSVLETWSYTLTATGTSPGLCLFLPEVLRLGK